MIFADHLEHHLPSADTPQTAKFANEIIEKTSTIVAVKSQLCFLIVPEERIFHQSRTTNLLMAKGLQLATGCKKIHMRLKNDQDLVREVNDYFLFKIIVHAVGTRSALQKLEQLLMVQPSLNLSEGDQRLKLHAIIQNVIKNLDKVSIQHRALNQRAVIYNTIPTDL